MEKSSCAHPLGHIQTISTHNGLIPMQLIALGDGWLYLNNKFNARHALQMTEFMQLGFNHYMKINSVMLEVCKWLIVTYIH